MSESCNDLLGMVNSQNIDTSLINDVLSKSNAGTVISDKVMEISDIINEIGNKYKKKIEELNTLNIIVAGKTGVGKSTLINSVFKGNLAQTGVGKPVTQSTKAITKPGVPLKVYDTKGFELGKDAQEKVKVDIAKLIKDGNKNYNINEMIHCIWYCISTVSNRIEPEEIEWLRELTAIDGVKQVPVIIILTQAFSKKNADIMRKMIMNEGLNVIGVIPILAQDYEINEEYVAKAYGLEELIQLMSKELPNKLQATIQNVQIASINLKKKYANRIVKSCAVATLIEGFVPIPLTDSLMMIPTQVSMLVSITVAFGISVDKGTLATAITSVLGTKGATITGKAISKQLAKLLPGGSIIGGAISGTTASLVTIALGQSYIKIMEAVCRGELKESEIGTDKGKRMFEQSFKERLKANKNMSKKDILNGNLNTDY